MAGVATPMVPKRIFITGASGYVGSRVTAHAIAQGYVVHGLARSDASAKKLQNLGAVPVLGNKDNLDVLRRAAAEADIVMHLANPLRDNFGMTAEEIHRIQCVTMAALVDGMQGSNKPLVITSGSIAAAPDPNGGETDETSPPWPLAQAVHMRIKDEEFIIPLGREKEVKVSVIRLAPVVYGRGASGPTWYLRSCAPLREVPYIDEGRTVSSYVHVDDAARMYLLAATKAKDGAIFNCTSETNVTIKDFSEAIADALGKSTRSVGVEEFFSMMPKFFTTLQLKQHRASSDKARRDLGWESREIGVLEDLRTGSYRPLAEELRRKAT